MNYMIKFLCHVFPKNFAQHVGIVFTHYHHDYQMQINKNKKNDPRTTAKSKLVPKIMRLIQETTNEDYFEPPVYFLDSYVEDDNSKRELNLLMAFAKHLKPIQDIRGNINLKYKKEEEEFEIRPITKNEGNFIVTYLKKYIRKKFIDYDNIPTYSDWKYVDQEIKREDIPVRYIPTNSNENKKQEDKKQEVKKQEENTFLDILEVTGKIATIILPFVIPFALKK